MASKLKGIGRSLVFVMSFVVIAGLVFYASLMLFLGGGETVRVPDLLGKQVMMALEELAKQNISITIDKLEYSDDFEKGVVIAQTPRAGGKLRKGRALRLVISQGLNQFAMPEIVGMDESLAKQVLENQGVASESVWYSCSSLNKGTVIAQVPKAKNVTKRSIAAQMIVSSGSCRRYYVVGKFTKLPQSYVQKVFNEHDVPLVIGKMTASDALLKDYRAYIDGDIIRQNRASGSVVATSQGVPIMQLVSYESGYTPDAKTIYRYVRFTVPLGFTQSYFNLRYVAKEFVPEEIDIKVSPGKNIEWVVITPLGFETSLHIDGQLALPFHLTEELL